MPPAPPGVNHIHSISISLARAHARDAARLPAGSPRALPSHILHKATPTPPRQATTAAAHRGISCRCCDICTAAACTDTRAGSLTHLVAATCWSELSAHRPPAAPRGILRPDARRSTTSSSTPELFLGSLSLFWLGLGSDFIGDFGGSTREKICWSWID
jgi:hypothetical protein